MLQGLYDHVLDVLTVLVTQPVEPTERFYFVYVLTFLALAYVSYAKYARKSKPGFFRYVFPRRIYLHRSAVVDYCIFVINIFLSPVTALFGAALMTAISIAVGNGLVALNGGEPVVTGSWGTATYVAFIIGFTVVSDFSVYLIHRFHHNSDVFWPIHALHHSAVVMTPFTLFRKHPLWNFLTNVFTKSCTGVFQGVFVFVFYGTPAFEVLFGINTIYMLFNFFGSNLRHSHIWLSWGKPLSYLFISPAMHQIHHDPQRMRMNYGEIFAIWDWMFGTLYIPERREKFEIGLGKEGNPHNTLLRAYTVPLVDMWRQGVAKLSALKPGSTPSQR